MAGKKYRPDWYVLYRKQKGSAKLRGIEFLLTPEEWWKIWCDSGHFAERGRRTNQYCMARFNDKGPYAIGNVEIITTRHNNVMGSTGRWHKPATIAKMKRIHKGAQYRPHKLDGQNLAVARSLCQSGLLRIVIAKKFGVSRATLRRALKR